MDVIQESGYPSVCFVLVDGVLGVLDFGKNGFGAGGRCVGSGIAVVGVDVPVDAVHEALQAENTPRGWRSVPDPPN